jgi:hypothetical protein
MAKRIHYTYKKLFKGNWAHPVVVFIANIFATTANSKQLALEATTAQVGQIPSVSVTALADFKAPLCWWPSRHFLWLFRAANLNNISIPNSVIIFPDLRKKKN